MPEIRTITERFKFNLLIAVISTIALLLPDYIAKLFTENNQAALSKIFIIGMFLLSLFLSFTPRKFILFILGFFMVIELIQFGHLFYYGNLITASKMKLLIVDFDEVWEAAGEAITFLYFVPLIVIIPYGAIFYFTKKLENKRNKNAWMIILVLVVLAIIPYRVNKAYSGVNYYPDPADHSLRNSLYATCNAIINFVSPKVINKSKYLDYKIQSIDNNLKQNINVILIIGEGVNYKNMSLFGYQKETSPLLSKLKNDPNFSYLPGLSAAVSTTVSTPLLINGIYEPNNYQELEHKNANLFKLAKKHNFKNFYISAQTGALLSNLSAEYIDYKIFRKKEEKLFDTFQDEALLKIIPNLKYADKNFIVINQRNAHTPYEYNYKHNKEIKFFSTDATDYQKFLVDTYDNAMLYNDYIIYSIIDFYRKKFKDGPTYIFFTSDHGEGLGSPVYGHSVLAREVAEVPFISYVINGEKPQAKAPICHYEVHNLIAKALGFEITNKNIKSGVCYLQGTDLYGMNEFLEIKK